MSFKTSDYIELGKELLQVLIILVIGIILIKILKKVIKKGLKNTRLDPLVHAFIMTGITIALYAVLCLVMLASIGFEISGLIVGLGAVGAAVVFALKDSLVNVAGGIIIVAAKPFSKGDLIELNGTKGIAEKIDIMFTTIRTVNNEVITIPNGLLTTSALINYTKEDIRRLHLKLGVSYEDDLDLVRERLMAVAKASDRVLDYPEPMVGVYGHLDSAIGIDFKAWCNTDDFIEVEYQLYEDVKKDFDRHNISIPFPQLDIHSK